MKVIAGYTWLFAILGITSYVLTACSISYQSLSLYGNSTMGLEEDKSKPNTNKFNVEVRMSNMPWHAHENEKESIK